MRIPIPRFGLDRVDMPRAMSAVVLAILVYVLTLNQTNTVSQWQTSFTVPVDVVNVPSGLVATQQPNPVHVSLHATQQAYSQLQPGSFSAEIDASHATPGDNQLPVVVRSTDPNVSEVSADVPEMTIHLEQIEQRVLPIQVQPAGQLPPGYQLGQPTATPSSVTVTGPSSLVEKATAAVIPVRVEGATLSVSGTYTASIVDAQGTAIVDPTLSVQPASVAVQVPISQLTQYKSVGVQPVTQGVPSAGYVVESIDVNPPAATLVGSEAGLVSASFVQTQPIDVSGVNTTVVRQVGLVPPSGSILLQPDQVVTATVHVAPLQMTQSVQVVPSIVNVTSNVAVAQSPAPVTLTITGPAPSMSSLASGDLRVTLDASGKGPGQYQIAPQVQNLPGGVTLDGINPGQVTITLTPTPTPQPSG